MTGTELILPNGRSIDVRDRTHTLEQRDPRAATTNLGYQTPTLPMVQEWDATQAFRYGYLANVIGYRAVQIRATAAASVNLVAGTDPAKPNDINPNSPILKLLGPPPGGPAKGLSARKLIRWTFAQWIVTGRFGWEIEHPDTNTSGPPVALWPLVSASLDAVPSKGGSDWFKSFKYGSWSDRKTLSADQVFYGWTPGPLDFRQAESGLQASRYDLSLINLCDRYGLGFLKNNAVPATVITTTKFPDEEHKERFARAWQGEFGGPENAGRAYIHEVDDDGDGPVGDSIHITQLGLSQKDARMVETRKEALREVAWSLGVPWSKIDASERTFDNAEIEDRTFWEEVMLPDLQDFADEINMQLAPLFGSDVVWFDLRSVRALSQKRINPITAEVGAPSMVFAQLMQINEARADYGLEPVEDGDRMMTVEEINALRGGDIGIEDLGTTPPPAAPDPTAGGDSDDEDEDDDQDDDDRNAGGELETRVADPEAIEARRARLWSQTDAVATSIEGRWVRAFRRLFARQEEATLSRLTGRRGKQAGLGETRDVNDLDTDEFFTRAFWVTQTAEIAEDLYGQAAGAGIDRLNLLFEIDFDISAPWVDEFIEARAQQLAGQVTDTTYDAIRSELVAGVADGESIDDLAARVRKVFAHADKTRSVTIARTEVISAYNGAGMKGAEMLPRDVVAGAEWISTRDARTRDAHASADGQVRMIGEPFEVAGDSLEFPGDPSGRSGNVINCRCAVAFLTPSEFLEASNRARPTVEIRTAKAVLSMIPEGPLDELALRRVLEGAA
jgi:hypothetical protein